MTLEVAGVEDGDVFRAGADEEGLLDVFRAPILAFLGGGDDDEWPVRPAGELDEFGDGRLLQPPAAVDEQRAFRGADFWFVGESGRGECEEGGEDVAHVLGMTNDEWRMTKAALVVRHSPFVIRH